MAAGAPVGYVGGRGVHYLPAEDLHSAYPQYQGEWLPPGVGSNQVCDILADDTVVGETGKAFAAADCSGFENHARQQISAQQPQIDELDGKICWLLSPEVQTRLLLPGLPALLNGANVSFTLGLYFQPLELESNGIVWSVCSTGNTDYHTVSAPRSGGPEYSTNRRRSNVESATGDSVASLTHRRLMVEFTAAQATIYVDDNIETLTPDAVVATTGSLNTDTCIIGAWMLNGALQGFWRGRLRRCQIWLGTLSAAQKTNWNTNVVEN